VLGPIQQHFIGVSNRFPSAGAVQFTIPCGLAFGLLPFPPCQHLVHIETTQADPSPFSILYADAERGIQRRRLGPILDNAMLVGFARLAVRQAHLGQRLPHSVDSHADAHTADSHVTGEIEGSSIQEGIDDVFRAGEEHIHAGGSLGIAKDVQRPLCFLRTENRVHVGLRHQRTELRQLLSQRHWRAPLDGWKYAGWLRQNRG
jgi:hypothetical protein